MYGGMNGSGTVFIAAFPVRASNAWPPIFERGTLAILTVFPILNQSSIWSIVNSDASRLMVKKLNKPTLLWIMTKKLWVCCATEM